MARPRTLDSHHKRRLDDSGWFPHDVEFSSKTRTLKLDNMAAEALYFRMTAIAWKGRTDGVVGWDVLMHDISRTVTDNDVHGMLSDLVRVGLLEQLDSDKWVVVDYLEWNKSKAELDAIDTASRVQGTWGNHCRHHVTDGKVPGPTGCKGCDFHRLEHSGVVKGCAKCSKDGLTHFVEWVTETSEAEPQVTGHAVGGAIGGRDSTRRRHESLDTYAYADTDTDAQHVVVDPDATPTASVDNPVAPDGATLTVVADNPHIAAVNELCEHLARRITQHRDGNEPAISDRWRKDMGLLTRIGPASRAKREPIEPDRIHRAIDTVFDKLADPESGSGFCWADQIQSPSSLRKHWDQLAMAAKRANNTSQNRTGLDAIALTDQLDAMLAAESAHTS